MNKCSGGHISEVDENTCVHYCWDVYFINKFNKSVMLGIKDISGMYTRWLRFEREINDASYDGNKITITLHEHRER